MASISVTQNAWRKMAEIILKSKHNLGFIYSASSGGCNGFIFELNLIQQKVYENKGVYELKGKLRSVQLR